MLSSVKLSQEISRSGLEICTWSSLKAKFVRQQLALPSALLISLAYYLNVIPQHFFTGGIVCTSSGKRWIKELNHRSPPLPHLLLLHLLRRSENWSRMAGPGWQHFVLCSLGGSQRHRTITLWVWLFYCLSASLTFSVYLSVKFLEKFRSSLQGSHPGKHSIESLT